MFTYHINKAVKCCLDLHTSLIESLLVFGLPLAHIFKLLRKLD